MEAEECVVLESVYFPKTFYSPAIFFIFWYKADKSLYPDSLSFSRALVTEGIIPFSFAVIRILPVPITFRPYLRAANLPLYSSIRSRIFSF